MGGNLGMYILTSHFFLALFIGYVAKKYFDRNFLIWTVIAFLVPVISGIALLILGYEGVYCPHCGKKNRKNWEKCHYCGYDIKKFLEEESKRREIEKSLLKKWGK
ncbi:MAG: zinc ribbon domain-containing protein [Fusobacteriaceae bacterium]